MVSKIVAKQYLLEFNTMIICENGDVYKTNLFDLGSKEYTEALRYILVEGFNIRGRDAFKLGLILKRSSGIRIVSDNAKIKLFYAT